MSSEVVQRTNQRKAVLKPRLDVQKALHARDDRRVALRSEARDMAMEKRRSLAEETAAQAPVPHDMVQAVVSAGRAIVGDGQTAPDVVTRLGGVRALRTLLCNADTPPVAEVVSLGLVPHLVACLALGGPPELLHEATWTLTNVAAGSHEQTCSVITSNAIPYLIAFVASDSDDDDDSHKLRDQALWALGNIVSDSVQCRDAVLGLGLLDPLLRCVLTTRRLGTRRNASWVLSNMCRDEPPDEVRRAILVPLVQLTGLDDGETICNACWGLSFLARNHARDVVTAGALPQVMRLMGNPRYSVQRPALRCVGNILAGEDALTAAVLQSGVLPYLMALVTSRDKVIRREACWSLSNVAAGPREQIQALLDSRVVPLIVEVATRSDFETRKEAAWVLSTALVGADAEQTGALVLQGVVDPLCKLLDSPDTRLVLTILCGLERLLSTGEAMVKSGMATGCGANVYLPLVEQAGAVSIIEKHAYHINKDVSSMASGIVDLYLDCSAALADAPPSAAEAAASMNPNDLAF